MGGKVTRPAMPASTSVLELEDFLALTRQAEPVPP
jgi:hypothetical protein